jgi:hypothetical protein
MDTVKSLLKSAQFYGIVRMALSMIAALLAKRGYDMSSYLEGITAFVVAIAVAWWSIKSKKPRKIILPK